PAVPNRARETSHGRGVCHSTAPALAWSSQEARTERQGDLVEGIESFTDRRQVGVPMSLPFEAQHPVEAVPGERAEELVEREGAGARGDELAVGVAVLDVKVAGAPAHP